MRQNISVEFPKNIVHVQLDLELLWHDSCCNQVTHTYAHGRGRWQLVNQSSLLVHLKYMVLNELTDISQCHQSKVVWRTLESEKPAPRQSVRYFSSQFFFFFQCKSIFFLQWFLMLWPYAGGSWADNRPQCADRPSLPTLYPPFPSNSLPYRATNQPLWEPSTAPTTRSGLDPPPTSSPRHLPLTSTSHCPSLCSQSTPQKTVSFAVWLKLGVQDCLIYYTTYWLATAHWKLIQVLCSLI